MTSCVTGRNLNNVKKKKVNKKCCLISGNWVNLTKTAHRLNPILFYSVNCENVLLVAIFLFFFFYILKFLCRIILFSFAISSFSFISVIKCFVKKRVKYYQDVFKFPLDDAHDSLKLC